MAGDANVERARGLLREAIAMIDQEEGDPSDEEIAGKIRLALDALNGGANA